MWLLKWLSWLQFETSAAFAQKHNLKVLARICGFGDAAQVSFLLQFIPLIAMVASHMHNKHSNLYLSLFNFILGKKDKERIETKGNSDVAPQRESWSCFIFELA
jgi:hypothetical protein